MTLEDRETAEKVLNQLEELDQRHQAPGLSLKNNEILARRGAILSELARIAGRPDYIQ